MFHRIELWVYSFFINALALTVPVYVIHALTRYLADGLNATLYSLTFGVIVALILENVLRNFRIKSLVAFNSESKVTEDFHCIRSNFEVRAGPKLTVFFPKIKGNARAEINWQDR